MIKMRDVSKKYGNVTALSGVSLSVPEGGRAAIVGRSGSGKSVLLRCVNALEKPDSGTVSVGGDLLTAGRRERARAVAKTGMVFQHFNLFSHLNVLDNIVLAPVRGQKKNVREAIERAESLLEQVGLPDKRFAYPNELSGGQMQRVAIARALATDPKVLLFDEPTSALDPSNTHEVLEVIEKIARTGKTILLVTHELAFVREVATYVYYIDEHTVYEEGPADAVLRDPKREKTRAFLEHASM